ncbi:hypothetical protein R6Z07F_018082 [Ovis aries]
MVGGQRSKAGTVHSKVSSYYGSLHRSGDGRYTPCSYRGMEERLPHGSMSRLTDHSRHSSSHQLNEQLPHSSIRDLSNNPMTHITHGTSMNQVIEEDGTSAQIVLRNGNLDKVKLPGVGRQIQLKRSLVNRVARQTLRQMGTIVANVTFEAMAQKEDMEKRITTLEKCYLAAQRKAISVHNLNDKLENEIANKDSTHQQKEDKGLQLQECLEPAEQKLQQTLLEVEAELAQRVAALSKVKERQGNIEERLCQMEAQLEEKSKEPPWVQPLKDQDRECRQQASVLAQVFKSDEGVSDSEGDGVTLFSSAALLSPSGQADAKTLPVMIQEQLDRISEEIRLIQEEENTDQQAEGIESRVGRGSLSNLHHFQSLNSLNLNPASSHAGSCSPSRGRSKPRRRQRSPAREVDKLGFMTLGVASSTAAVGGTLVRTDARQPRPCSDHSGCSGAPGSRSLLLRALPG